MIIAETIINLMKHRAKAYTLKRVQIGLIYSGVELDCSVTGVAYTFPKKTPCGPQILDRLKPFAGKNASELIPFLGGNDLVASSLALATVNAILADSPKPEGMEAGDILESLDIHRGDTICMVGCFLPILAALENRQVSVTSVDQIPKPGSRPAEEVESLLPNSDIAIITATSIINNTIDHLLELAGSCRQAALLGPSTPLIKEAFSGTPIVSLSGVRVSDCERVLQTISEGGGFREFKRYCQKVNLRLN